MHRTAAAGRVASSSVCGRTLRDSLEPRESHFEVPVLSAWCHLRVVYSITFETDEVFIHKEGDGRDPLPRPRDWKETWSQRPWRPTPS